MMADQQRDRRTFRGVTQPLTIGHRIGDGLFQQYWHVAIDAVQAVGHVERVRRGDDDAVGTVACKQLAEAGVAGHAGSPGIVLRSRCWVDEGGKLALTALADQLDMAAANVASPGNRNAEHAHYKRSCTHVCVHGIGFSQ